LKPSKQTGNFLKANGYKHCNNRVLAYGINFTVLLLRFEGLFEGIKGKWRMTSGEWRMANGEWRVMSDLLYFVLRNSYFVLRNSYFVIRTSYFVPPPSPCVYSTYIFLCSWVKFSVLCVIF
jgi:hypothetical protein